MDNLPVLKNGYESWNSLMTSVYLRLPGNVRKMLRAVTGLTKVFKRVKIPGAGAEA